MSLCRAEEPELVLRVMEVSPALCMVRAGLNRGVSVGVCWVPGTLVQVRKQNLNFYFGKVTFSRCLAQHLWSRQ